MSEPAFNLLDESWLLVMRPDGQREKLSLPELFSRAEEFRCLAGELPTQNIAVLRLLLAVLHAVIAGYDEDGRETQAETAGEALARWKHIWKARRFPAEIITAYLHKYRDRFWLFDDKRPFYQVPGFLEGTTATTCAADNLNQEISESNNAATSRFFLQRSGEGRTYLEFDEAARWLVCLMAYDTSVKPSGSKCWLGTFSVIFADGDTLFETLMLNLVLSSRSDPSLEAHPSWEADTATISVHNEIPLPDNFAALYTMQTRRVILTRERDKVIGYREQCGDFFKDANESVEPMASWRQSKTDENYFPVRSRHERQLWRDFSALLSQGEGPTLCPGVVAWLNHLVRKRIISRSQIRLQTVSVEYDAMGYCIKNIASDTLSFSTHMLSEKGSSWIPAILGEIAVADALVEQLAFLADRIEKAGGNRDGGERKSAARQRAYFSLDIPFREWLEAINPESDEMSVAAQSWWETARQIVRRLGQELVAEAGPQALVGRTITEKSGRQEKEVSYSAPEAYNYFLMRTASREALMTGGKKND